jgi:hypothetical protein
VGGKEMLAKAHAATVLAASWVSEERKQLQSIEAARMARAATRVLEGSQRAALVLARLRNGGRQPSRCSTSRFRKAGRR